MPRSGPIEKRSASHSVHSWSKFQRIAAIRRSLNFDLETVTLGCSDFKTGSLLNPLDEGRRIGLEEWVFLAETLPSEELFSRADRLRSRYHPDDVVTYVVDRNINYSNVCDVVCTFCAFYRRPGSPEGYVLSHEQIFQKVEETIRLGACIRDCRCHITRTFSDS
jgi:hypothetical protein